MYRRDGGGSMKIIVSYRARDIYHIPDKEWQEAMALCGNDIEDAFYCVLTEDKDGSGSGRDFLYDGEVHDWLVGAVKDDETGRQGG
jgi:hypothetical protein